MELLFEHFAKDGDTAVTPLMIASEQGYLTIVELLVIHGANIEVVNQVRFMKVSYCINY